MAFQFRRKISIRGFRAGNGEHHTNFPFLFWSMPPGVPFISGDPNDDNPETHYHFWLKSVANGGQVFSEQGLDIAFFLDAQGTILLPFERVAYNPVNGLCEFYVKLPDLFNPQPGHIGPIALELYVFYGDPTPFDRANRNAVWDDTFVGVYHFGDGLTLDCSDSTHYGNHGTAQEGAIAAPGMVGTAVNGLPTGGSLGCMGTGYVSIPSPSNASFDFNDGMTFEYSIYNNPGAPIGNANIANGQILNKFRNLIEDPLHGGDGFLIEVTDVFQPGLAIQYFHNAFETVPPFVAFTGTGDTNVIFVENVARYDQINGQLLLQGNINVNGSPQAWGPVAISRTNAPLYIGAGTDGFGNTAHRWPGWIDEVRLSNQPRSLEWTRVTFNNLSDPAHQFFIVGPSENVSRRQPQVFVIT
jgi:hypothetical protein